MRTSFARRLALGFALVALGGAVLTAVLVNLAFSSRFDAYLAEQRELREDALLAVLAGAYARGGGWDDDLLGVVTPTLVMAGSEISVRDRSGQQVWSLRDERVTPAELAVHRAMMGTGELAGARSRDVVVDGRTVGSAQLSVPSGAVPAADKALRDSVNRLLAVGSLAAALAALAAGLGVARQAARPIGALTSAAAAWTGGQRAARVPVTRTDELGDLARTFNALADTVEREDLVRRQFTASVAHELRTPLAVLRSQLEGAQDGVVAVDVRLLASLHDESLRLGRLVEDLEALTAADAAGFSLRKDAVRLDLLVERALQAAGPRLAARGLQVAVDLQPATVDGDEARLRQVLDNLLGNALKHVPEGGRLTVATHVGTEGVLLQVADDGPGFAPDEHESVLLRFRRGRGVTASGSGIGLAVVVELAQAHGGTVRLGRSSLGGALVAVQLPASAARASARRAVAAPRGGAPDHPVMAHREPTGRS